MPSKKINGLVRLFRPELPLAAGICVTTGQVLAAGRLPSWQVGILGFMCGFALSSAALILNDYFDYEIDLGEEIAGDAMDMEGDKKRGSRSIALLKGKQVAVKITVSLWCLVILLSFLPILMQWLGTSYQVMILITDVVLIYFSTRLLKSQTPAAGRRAMRGAYLGATLGIVAFIIGRFIV